MAKITLSENAGPYKCVIDTEVMCVDIEETFLGTRFVTEDKEKLSVCMRDVGYELVYDSPSTEGSVVVELKGGDIYINGAPVFFGDLADKQLPASGIARGAVGTGGEAVD